jgi:sec-independent protein translocase protein TatB
MLDVGFSEILLTSAIALIVLGPERLPKVARQVGNWMGRARAMARQLSEQLEREVSAEELLKTQKKAVPSANASGNGAALPYSSAFDAAAPATGNAPPAAQGDTVPSDTTPGDTAPAAVPAEPVYGLAAAFTTPAAMHANDAPAAAPPATDPPLMDSPITDARMAESKAATTDHKSPT